MKIRFTKEALKDVNKLSPRLKSKLKDILERIISQEPYSGKTLVGQLKGIYSKRLSFQDRIVYTIDEDDKRVYIHRTRPHYGD